MGLIDIKNYLRQHGQASLTDLSNHFRAEPDAVRAMLDHWQRKGKVARVQGGGCGKGCKGCCSAPAVEVYRWQEEASVGLPISILPLG